MRALEFITGHVIYHPAYTFKFKLKTTLMFAEGGGTQDIALQVTGVVVY